MPKQINTYKIGQSLVRMFGLKGRYQPVLDETIVPVVLVGEQPTPDAIAGFGSQICAAAGVGNQNVVIFSNPTGSGRLVIVDQVTISTPAADWVQIDTATAAGGGAKRRRDLRTVEIISLTVRVAAGVIVLGQYLVHTDLMSPPVEIGVTLTPGTALQIRQNAANSTMEVSYLFREFLDPAGTLVL